MARDDKSYLVIEMQKQADGSLAHLVDAYTDRNTAEQKYHTVLSFAAVSNLPIHTAVIMTDEGAVLKKEVYRHEVTE